MVHLALRIALDVLRRQERALATGRFVFVYGVIAEQLQMSCAPQAAVWS